jgi:hypothetical protein
MDNSNVWMLYNAGQNASIRILFVNLSVYQHSGGGVGNPRAGGEYEIAAAKAYDVLEG